jgi:acyl-CoA dehydrogenase
MNFEYSEKVKTLEARLRAFMDEHIYPNEAVYHEQIRQGDRWQPVPLLED